MSVTALRDEQNAITGYLLIGPDNTARKQVEAERMLLDQRVRDQQFYTRSLIESNIAALIHQDSELNEMVKEIPILAVMQKLEKRALVANEAVPAEIKEYGRGAASFCHSSQSFPGSNDDIGR